MNKEDTYKYKHIDTLVECSRFKQDVKDHFIYNWLPIDSSKCVPNPNIRTNYFSAYHGELVSIRIINEDRIMFNSEDEIIFNKEDNIVRDVLAEHLCLAKKEKKDYVDSAHEFFKQCRPSLFYQLALITYRNARLYKPEVIDITRKYDLFVGIELNPIMDFSNVGRNNINERTYSKSDFSNAAIINPMIYTLSGYFDGERDDRPYFNIYNIDTALKEYLSSIHIDSKKKSVLNHDVHKHALAMELYTHLHPLDHDIDHRYIMYLLGYYGFKEYDHDGPTFILDKDYEILTDKDAPAPFLKLKESFSKERDSIDTAIKECEEIDANLRIKR